ncbi:DUF7681 family protein [Methylobacterium soli]|uniref:Acb2/Tad1 domain-containing protein n=1 Tax=Methylobacterium soli TaxID=553447 RepID=UPI00177FD848|nr:hypothetical protein [Methylobacterium soli]GJE41279.1 hypothetical protein AEGHOMDF_0441 [Methylobacterium soli]
MESANSGRDAVQQEPNVPGQTEYQGLPVAGYRPQTGDKVGIVNANKQAEERTLRILDELAQRDDVDKRWLAVGRTAIENGFMAVNRSVFQPGRVTLPEDATTAANAGQYLDAPPRVPRTDGGLPPGRPHP